MRDMTIERHLKPRPPLPPRSEEYIDISGHLRVPVARAWYPWDEARAPKREGWEPFFVAIDLSDPIQKVVSYRRTGVTA